MASLPKGKQMVQRRLGLYRRVLQGHRSDTSIELPGVRRIQPCAKVPLPLAQCFCPSVIKGSSGQWVSAWAIPAPGNSQVWHGENEGQVAVWSSITLHSGLVQFFSCSCCTHVGTWLLFLTWENGRTGGGHGRSWLLTQPGLYCNIMFRRGLNFRNDAASCVPLAGCLLPLLLPALSGERCETTLPFWTEQWVNKQRQNPSWPRRNSAGVTFASD